MLANSSPLLKDLLTHNGIGTAAFGVVHIADLASPAPSSFWQYFALIALNTAMTFLWRWFREWRRGKGREKQIADQLEQLAKSVSQLRADFEASQKPKRARR